MYMFHDVLYCVMEISNMFEIYIFVIETFLCYSGIVDHIIKVQYYRTRKYFMNNKQLE